MFKKILKFIIVIAILLTEAIIIIKWMNKTIVKKYKNSGERNDVNFQIMNKLCKVNQMNRSIASHLEKKGVNRIAIYGMSDIGKALKKELQDSNIQVCYGIDKSIQGEVDGLKVIYPDSSIEKVDMIVVTPCYFYVDIKEELKQHTEVPIVSLEDILCEIINDDIE